MVLPQMKISVYLKVKTKEKGQDPVHDGIHILPQILLKYSTINKIWVNNIWPW